MYVILVTHGFGKCQDKLSTILYVLLTNLVQWNVLSRLRRVSKLRYLHAEMS